MATKNEVKNESNNQVSNPEMEQFVQEHISSVPRMWKNRFDSWTLEEKVARINQWEKNKKNIEDYRERQKLENKVKALFEQKRPSTEEVLKVIEFCKSFIEQSKAQEIAKIDEEIQKLSQMKQQLEMNQAMTVLEQRFLEVAIRQLPLLVRELTELNNNLKELKDEIRERVRD